MTFAEMERSYRSLRAQMEAGRLTGQAFQDQVNQLRLQDASGRWWQIDAASGGWLAWNGAAWVPAQPPQTARESTQPRQAGPARATPRKERSRRWWDVFSVVGGAAMGLIYFLWASVRSATEGNDIITPLLMAGLPLLLSVLRRPVDRLLTPLHMVLGRIPRLMRVGAGLAAPFLVSTWLYGGGSMTEYPFLRWSVVLGTLTSYLILRVPEVPGLRQRLTGGQ